MSNNQKKLVMTPVILQWMKKHISNMAFYKHESGTYRILHTGEESFTVVDEDTGDEHEFRFEDINIDDENFLALMPFSLSSKVSTNNLTMSVQDWIDGISTEDDFGTMYAKWWMNSMLAPAAWLQSFRKVMKDINLFCTYKGKRWRVTGGSRLGDIWLTSDPTKDIGYEERVYVTECDQWSNMYDYDQSTVK